uniref:Uncharacterized protein n=1 Tax=Desertifilum tharense IPPAS B-1220 TaxID=1781255 RepID=A0ACD5H0Z4_9CYAN
MGDGGRRELGVGSWELGGRRELGVGRKLQTQHCFPTQHSALYTQHSVPHSALSTLHSALSPPLSTQHFTLSTQSPTQHTASQKLAQQHFTLSTQSPTQHSALYTQHSVPHSELGTRNFALLPPSLPSPTFGQVT